MPGISNLVKSQRPASNSDESLLQAERLSRMMMQENSFFMLGEMRVGCKIKYTIQFDKNINLIIQINLAFLSKFVSAKKKKYTT